MCAYIHPEREASKMKWVYNYTQHVSTRKKPASKGPSRRGKHDSNKSNEPTKPPLTKSAFPALPSAPVPSSKTAKNVPSRSMWGNGSLYNMEPQQNNKFSQPSFGTPDWSFAAQAAAERNNSFNVPSISPSGSSPLREGNWPESLNHVLAGVSSLVDDTPVSPSSLAISYSPVDTPEKVTESSPEKEVEKLELSPTEESDTPAVEVEKFVVEDKPKLLPSQSTIVSPTTATTPPVLPPTEVVGTKVDASPSVEAPKEETKDGKSLKIKKEVSVAPVATKKAPSKEVAPKEIFSKPRVMEEPAELDTYRRFSLRGGKASTEAVQPSTTESESSKTSKKGTRNRKKHKRQEKHAAAAPAIVSLDESHKTETQHLDIPLPSHSNSTYQPTPIPQLVWNSIVAFFVALGTFLVHVGVGLKDAVVALAGALVAAFAALQDYFTRQNRSTVSTTNHTQRSRRSKRN